MLKETLKEIERQKRIVISYSIDPSHEFSQDLERRIRDLEQVSKKLSPEEVGAIQRRRIDWELMKKLSNCKGYAIGTFKKFLRNIKRNKSDKDLLILYEEQVSKMSLSDLRSLGGIYKNLGPSTFRLIEEYLKTKGYIN